ncbi:MAG: M23 family metallopeptidase [Dysgonamonadaceae bacterium]|jgi:murein DD-endopeptidase MepM/ murein hydrolase activator NlpD|nr:M23 family metallopeptidase [Dysgonamonadaceae bacterium]
MKINLLNYLLSIFFSAFYIAAATAQNIVPPMDIPLLMSGNFGELRNDHFHSGLDFKTQGVTGFPVKAVKEGYVSRIGVSPYGFGRAVYISHPDGTTSVYGHLDHFAPKIEAAVRDSQYLRESFTVNLIFTPGAFPVRQGETVAYSGNTGGSGGPHLHFELRDTRTEKVFDALPFFRGYVKDKTPPEIRGIMLFPQPGKGVAEGGTANAEFAIIKNKTGGCEFAENRTITAWGSLGAGIKAYDRMDGTTNIYGVKEIVFKVDGVEIFHSLLDGFFFDETRYINSFIDWNEWKNKRSFFMKSFIEPGNKLDVYRFARLNGIFSISEERPYDCRYELTDAYGNTTVFNFTILGVKSAIPEAREKSAFLAFDRDNSVSDKGISLEIPTGSLYSSISTDFRIYESSYPYSPVYELGERAPLHRYCPVSLDVTKDTYPDKSKYGIVMLADGKQTWIGGKYEDGKIRSKIRELGSYTVLVDNVPPSISPLKPLRWAKNRKIAFRITDDLSGIESWRGTLNGRFALFEYDAKSASLFCNFDAKRMKSGQNALHLTVTDGAGNVSEYDSVLNW